jgi:hypothetical protein
LPAWYPPLCAPTDMSPAGLESDLRDLNEHIVCAEAVVFAFDADAGVHTEADFLEKDPSGVLDAHVWKLVCEAQKHSGRTMMIVDFHAAGHVCLVLIYRCDIRRASAADTKAGVSSPPPPPPPHTHTHSRTLTAIKPLEAASTPAERAAERKISPARPPPRLLSRCKSTHIHPDFIQRLGATFKSLVTFLMVAFEPFPTMDGHCACCAHARATPRMRSAVCSDTAHAATLSI